MLVLSFYQENSFSLLLSWGWIVADQIPSASRDPGDPDVECLVAVMDVDGRHGPLRLAHSVFNRSSTRWPPEIVDSLLPSKSWVGLIFVILEIHFWMNLFRFSSLRFYNVNVLVFRRIVLVGTSFVIRSMWMYVWVNVGVFVLLNVIGFFTSLP